MQAGNYKHGHHFSRAKSSGFMPVLLVLKPYIVGW
jgi:hypothetical protein